MKLYLGDAGGMCGVCKGGGGVLEQCQVKWRVTIFITGSDVSVVVHQQLHYTTVTLGEEGDLGMESGLSYSLLIQC